MILRNENIINPDQSIQIQLPQIWEHDGFLILRDDLLPGGTKRRILTEILGKVPNKEIVYPAHPYGHGQLALALSCLPYRKKVTLLLPKLNSSRVPKVLSETLALSNVSYQVILNATSQSEVFQYAEKYAQEISDRYLFPIGFNTKEFLIGLKNLALSLPIVPTNVWVLAGSGLLVSALKLAWPNAKINAVNMGFSHVNLTGADNVYNAPESPFEPAKVLPPFPSASYYDAKLWQFVKLYAEKGDFVWNVA